jgi:hypothetical protein
MPRKGLFVELIDESASWLVVRGIRNHDVERAISKKAIRLPEITPNNRYSGSEPIQPCSSFGTVGQVALNLQSDHADRRLQQGQTEGYHTATCPGIQNTLSWSRPYKPSKDHGIFGDPVPAASLNNSDLVPKQSIDRLVRFQQFHVMDRVMPTRIRTGRFRGTGRVAAARICPKGSRHEHTPTSTVPVIKKRLSPIPTILSGRST